MSTTPLPLSITCPHCHAELSLPPHQAGQVADCPKCSGRFQVPLPMASSTMAPGSFAPMSAQQEFISKKIAAGLCGILLGGLGIHKFMLGLNNAGTIMLAVTLGGAFLGSCLIIPLLAPVAMGTIGLIEGVLYLTKGDEEFYQTYAVQKKEWF